MCLLLGEWGKMDVERAWKFHARSEELLKIGSLRERLYVSRQSTSGFDNRLILGIDRNCGRNESRSKKNITTCYLIGFD